MARPALWRIFAKSPFGQVQQHMAAVVEAALVIEPLFEALIAGEQERVKTIAKQISVLEGRADTIKSDVRDHLPKGLFMPVARGDILRHLSTQDAIADCAEDVGVLLTLRPMTVPDWMAPVLRDYIAQTVKVVKSADLLVKELDVLVQAGFGGPEVTTVRKMVDDLNLQEHLADKLQDQIAKALFAHEDDLKPIAVFMWSKIFNKIGDIANHAENVGDRIRVFIASS